uniref:Uncharacterized protein n=1 Tax=Heliothis virescens TaxID=7102 RepID=A0A2A4K1X7_HELVI
MGKQDAVPVKVIPGERNIVKKDGTTHTISKYYVVPKNFPQNHAPDLKVNVMRTRVINDERDPSNQVIWHNKEARQAGKVIIRKNDNGRPYVKALNVAALVPDADPNIPNSSVHVLVEPITIKTDITVKVNETERFKKPSPETTSDVTDDTQFYNSNYNKKQENLITSLFSSEVKRKAKINVERFWKLVRYYIATVPNQVKLLSKIEKLSTFLDIYRMLHQKSKGIPIDPIIDDLIGVLQKYRNVKKTKSKPAALDNQTHLDLNNNNSLWVKVYADSINDNEPFNSLRTDLNSSIERRDDDGLVIVSTVAPKSKNDKTTVYVQSSTAKVIETPKVEQNKTKGLLSRNKAKIKEPLDSNNATPITIVQVKSEPLIIENTSWENQPWAIGDDMKNDVPVISSRGTENVLSKTIDTKTQNNGSLPPMPEAMVKPDVTLIIPDTTKQEPLISPSIEYAEPVITEVKPQSDRPRIAGEKVKYKKPITIDGRINEAPAAEPQTKYEEPLIVPENTENGSPWITGKWVKFTEPLSANTPREKLSSAEKPLVIEKSSGTDLPWITGEWVKYDETSSADDSIKLEPDTEPEAKNKEPLLIPENIENDAPWTTGEWVGPLNEKRTKEIITEHDFPWSSSEWIKYDEPLTIDANTKHVPDAQPDLQYDRPVAIEEPIEKDLPWMPFEKTLNMDNIPKEKLLLGSRIKENGPFNIKKILHKFMPWGTDNWVKNYVTLEVGGSKRGQPMIDSVIKQDKPFFSGEIIGPWISDGWAKDAVPLHIDNVANKNPVIGSPINKNIPLNIEDILNINMPWITNEWVQDAVPLRFDNIVNKNAVTDSPITKNNPLNIEVTLNKDMPNITDDLVQGAVPLRFDNIGNKTAVTDSPITKNNPLNIEETLTTDVPWITDDWVKDSKPLPIDNVANKNPVIGSPINENNLLNIGGILNKDMPWITDDSVKDGKPLRIDNVANKNPVIGSPINEKNPLNIGGILNTEMPRITDEWVEYGEPLRIDNVANKNPTVGSPRVENNPLNIKAISANMPWYPDEWVKNYVPLNVDGTKNNLPVIGSRIKEDGPSIIKESSENDEPWIINDNPLIVNDQIIEEPEIETKIKEDKPFDIGQTAQNVPPLLKPLTIEELPWHIEDRKKKDLAWLLDQEAKKILPWTINNKKMQNPYQIYTYVINPTQVSYQNPQMNKIDGINSLQYANGIDVSGGNGLGLTTTLNKYQKNYRNQLPQSTYESQYNTFQQPNNVGVNPSYSQSVITENQNLLPVGSQTYSELEFTKNNPTTIQSNPISNEAVSYESLANQNNPGYSQSVITENQSFLPVGSAAYQKSEFVKSNPTIIQSNPILNEAVSYESLANQNNPGYSQSVITENQSFLPVGSAAYQESEFVKSNPTIIQSNPNLNEYSFYKLPGNQNNIVSGQHVTYGIENNQPMTNNPNDANFQSNVQQNPYGSQSNMVSGKKVSVESTVNIDVGNNRPTVTPLRPHMPSNGYEVQPNMESGKKVVMESNVNLAIGNQQPFSQIQTQNMQAGSPSQATMPNAYPSNSEVNYNAVNGPTVQQIDYVNGVVVPKTTQSLNQIVYTNTNGVSPNTNGVKLYNNVQQSRPQLAASYQLFSINNLLKLNEILRITELNALATNQRVALLNLRKIVSVLLTLANNFAQNGRGNNWYENIFHNVQKIYHPLHPYVYALIRQRWLHELLTLLNNNNYSLQVLNNPKLLALMGAWKFPENVISFLNTEKLVDGHVNPGMSYAPNPTTLNDNSNQKFMYNEATNSNVAMPNAGTNSLQIVNADANAILAILQKHMRFKVYLEKQEENVVGANKMMVLKEIVLFLQQKGYGPAVIQDLIRKVHGEMYLAESRQCHTEYQPDIVHHLYNVIFPVLRRSAQ